MKLKIAKVIVSAFVALLVAQAMNLTTPSAAAIIAILSVMGYEESFACGNRAKARGSRFGACHRNGDIRCFWV